MPVPRAHLQGVEPLFHVLTARIVASTFKLKPLFVVSLGYGQQSSDLQVDTRPLLLHTVHEFIFDQLQLRPSFCRSLRQLGIWVWGGFLRASSRLAAATKEALGNLPLSTNV